MQDMAATLSIPRPWSFVLRPQLNKYTAGEEREAREEEGRGTSDSFTPHGALGAPRHRKSANLPQAVFLSGKALAEEQAVFLKFIFGSTVVLQCKWREMVISVQKGNDPTKGMGSDGFQ